ncbi:RDD family protein [Jeotgalibacillus sp. ET6]|uniref:RDD family protein n=1 Tax=Jeotgalibacillus sp. ET6 TaxID=3037260 RepID=UPI002418306D|nr:RDD family protein [Jeotgalibacillus sp. ET6]MDG5472168.1 RDD family protein [Jeotgalibacillus sp. ET6]
MHRETNPAGFWSRLFANLLDGIIVFIPIFIVIYLITGEYTFTSMNSWTGDILYKLYHTITPLVWSGYVIGKRLAGIKIKRMDNGKLTFLNMFLREVVGIFLLSYITFGLSIVVSVFFIIFREDKRAVHDLIASTRVVHS